MQEVKMWYLSKTVWASLVTAVLGTLMFFGVGAAAQGQEDAIVETVMKIVTAITGLVTLIITVLFLSVTSIVRHPPSMQLSMPCFIAFATTGNSITGGTSWSRND